MSSAANVSSQQSSTFHQQQNSAQLQQTSQSIQIQLPEEQQIKSFNSLQQHEQQLLQPQQRHKYSFQQQNSQQELFKIKLQQHKCSQQQHFQKQQTSQHHRTTADSIVETKFPSIDNWNRFMRKNNNNDENDDEKNNNKDNNQYNNNKKHSHKNNNLLKTSSDQQTVSYNALRRVEDTHGTFSKKTSQNSSFSNAYKTLLQPSSSNHKSLQSSHKTSFFFNTNNNTHNNSTFNNTTTTYNTNNTTYNKNNNNTIYNTTNSYTNTTINNSEYILTEGKKCFQCPQCRYATDRKNNLKRHLGTMHRDCGRLLRCCDSVFSSKAAMREHIFAVHKSGYRCQFCGKTFCRKALLRRHEAGHDGCYGDVVKEGDGIFDDCKSLFVSDGLEKFEEKCKPACVSNEKAIVIEKAVIQNEAFVIQKVPNVNYVQKDEDDINKSTNNIAMKSLMEHINVGEDAGMYSQAAKPEPHFNIEHQFKLMEFYRRLHFNRLCYDSYFYSDYFKAFTDFSEFKRFNQKYQSSVLKNDAMENPFFQKSLTSFQFQHFLNLNECFMNLQKKFLFNESPYQNYYLQQKYAEDLKNSQLKLSK